MVISIMDVAFLEKRVTQPKPCINIPTVPGKDFPKQFLSSLKFTFTKGSFCAAARFVLCYNGPAKRADCCVDSNGGQNACRQPLPYFRYTLSNPRIAARPVRPIS